MTVGEILKEYRENRGYLLDELSELLGTSKETVDEWERNMSLPDLKRSILLSRLYGTTIDDMFCDLNVQEGLRTDIIEKFEHERWLNRMKNRVFW